MTAPGRGPGLIIAAPASGSGKTLLTLGLLAHLAGRGVRVASAKVGPDYIDPAFHAAASGRPCPNLDSWAMREATLAAILARLAHDADLVVAEGVMGLFDGAAVPEGVPNGSTADLAALTGWPVVLVIDVRGMAASAAALAAGFVRHRADVAIAGIILNRVGGERHRGAIVDALAGALPEVPVLGALPKADALAVPARHLGLVQACEHPELEAFLAAAARLVGAHIDIDALLRLARPSGLDGISKAGSPIPPLGNRIAIARDMAFAFTYPTTLNGWRDAGAQLSFFSPLADEAPPGDADAVYLPGGYPEVHAGRLAASEFFLAGLRRAAEQGALVFGECGGYMVLGEGIRDQDGLCHRMAGLLPAETSFARPRLHLGYRRARLIEDGGGLGPAGTAFRGHEFHYAATMREDGPSLFAATESSGATLPPAGLRSGRVMGSFIHLIDREN